MSRGSRWSRRAAAAAASVVGAAALLAFPGTNVAAATVDVPCTGTNSTDVASLKAAIAAANTAGGQTLALVPGCTYTLDTVDNTRTGANGLPAISSTMTIDGANTSITRSAAAGTPAFRFFETTATGNLTVRGLSLTNGAGTPEGGAVYGVGPVTISFSTLSANSTVGDGGAIFDSGVLTVANSNILGNTALGQGGGIASERDVGNTSYGLTVADSTLAANRGGSDGGGIHADNATVILNSTLTANTSPTGGGVYNGGTPGVSILDSTIANNDSTTALAGGGIANAGSTSALTMTNTIVAGNTRGNCGSSAGLHRVTDGGHNLENGTSCGFVSAAVNGEPMLGVLENNGFPTLTMSITPSSPAYGAGDATVCAAAPPNGAGGVDQRGYPRKTATACDIGAYEYFRVFTTPSPTAIPAPPTGAVSGGSPGTITGLVVVGLGLLLVALLGVIGRWRPPRYL